MKARSKEKRAALIRLYRAQATFQAIADEIGGTANGIRSTIRKMRDRGELEARPVPRRRGPRQ